MLKNMNDCLHIEGCVQCVFGKFTEDDGWCTYSSFKKMIDFESNDFVVGRLPFLGFPTWCPLENIESDCDGKEKE